MALKPITRQEQIIVGKNLEPITRMERFLKEYGGGSGGNSAQSDWNQTDSSAADFIKNKPFGDMPTGGDTLYFDGNTEGLEYIDVNGDGSFLFVRLCDTVVTKEDVANGYSFMAHVNEIVTGTVDGETAQSAFQDNGYGSLADAALVFPYDGFDLDGITIAKAGIYTVVAEGRGVPFSITIPGYTGFPGVKKIEEKYLPKPTTFYFGLEDNYLYTDVNCTVKATAAELRAAMPNLLISAMGAMTYYPAFVHDAGTHMTVVAVVATYDSMAIASEFFTAEYVPEG